MAQNRTFDYRQERSSEILNRKSLGLIPPGVLSGFHVSVDGAVTPGVLLTREGIRIEETEAFSVAVPPGHATLYRVDRIVCRHTYEKTVPAPVATWEVLEGTPQPGYPGEVPIAPEEPEDATTIATCDMSPGGTEWTTVYMSSLKFELINATYDRTLRKFFIIKGDQAAVLTYYNPNTGYMSVSIQAPNVLADGDEIVWPTPQLNVGPSGQPDVVNKMPLAGGTFSGAVVHNGKATFNGGIDIDADDVGSFVFDDWVTFSRHVPAAGANSENWLFNDFYWQAIASGPGTNLIVPIPHYVGSELVSVDVDCRNSDPSVVYDIEVGLSEIPYGNLLGTIDFSEETFSIPGNTQEFNNLVVKDPVTPFGALPYAFDNSKMLVLRVKTGAETIQFFGARFNYRRKRVVV